MSSGKFQKIHSRTPVSEGYFSIKWQAWGLHHYWKRKKKLRHTRFAVNFTRFLKTPFLQNTSGQLLLKHWVKVCHQWSKNWFVCSSCTLVWQNKTCLRCSKCRNANKKTLREKCPNTEFFLVRVFPLSDWI